MDPALVTLAQRLHRAPGRRRTLKRPLAEETLLDETPKALIVDGRGGLARLQVRAELPLSQALEIASLLADRHGGVEAGTAPQAEDGERGTGRKL